jgi:phosphoribosylanthranilate isomerase
VFLKVCGITRLTDALHAVRQGATAIGFVFWPASPRSVAPEQVKAIVSELPSSVMTVGVFVNESIDGIRRVVAATGLTAVQLHGDEPPAYADALPWPLFRSASVDSAADVGDAWAPETTLLLDAADSARRGGAGMVVDWPRAAALARNRRVVLAGGLTPLNVTAAIETVRPYGVDVSSGVEASPGVKDFNKVTEFLANARRAFEKP